ncbi:MAG: FliM/FliN family flagellar motor switch protein [Pyrinomonadaceae bacterium]
MNASKTREAKETKAAAENPLDPFAVDFFGEKKTAPREEKNQSETHETKSLNGSKKKTVKTVKWFEKIPYLTRDQFLFSERLEKLPANLTKAAAHKIAETATRYTFQTPKTVSCQMLSITEVDLGKTLKQFGKSPQTFLALGCQPENSTALLAFDTGFASSVIDLILSGKGDELKVPRKLSPIENTILEFLGGNILAGINDWVGQNIFCLQSVENDLNNIFEKNERGAEAVFRLDFAEFSGIITLLASREFLTSLDKTQNPLLIPKNGKDKFAAFEKIAPRLNFRVQIGTTVLDADSLSYLETDDIVLIEHPLVRFQNSTFSGSGAVNLGSGENFNLTGQFLQGDVLSDSSDELSLKLEEIKSAVIRRKQNFDRLDMEKKETEKAEEQLDKTGGQNEEIVENAENEEVIEEAEENTTALENVLVNLRVEIAGDKISLREVQKLRSGQILNLGCRPTDAVRILTDTSDQPVALGELVDIEGQLGVRLTRIFV